MTPVTRGDRRGDDDATTGAGGPARTARAPWTPAPPSEPDVSGAAVVATPADDAPDAPEADAPDRDGAPSGSLALRVDRLFDTFRRPDGREYSYDEVAATMGAGGGATISANYVYMLRRGQRDNPTKRHLEALAKFFHVPVAYFFDKEAADLIDDELATLTALRDAQVIHVAMRAAGLSPRSLDAIRNMIEQARQIEGLPTGPEVS